jgi:plastocyanin
MRVARTALTAGWTAARRHSRNATIIAGVVVLALAANGASTDASTGRTVTARGSDQFIPNAKIMATFRFSPGQITIGSGETVTFTNDTTDPHTLTIVDKADVPTDTNAVFNCGAPGTVCNEVFNLFGGGPPVSQFFNASGAPGLDGRLDTLLVLPGESISAPVSAPSGSTLYFICVIHAWMQGTLTVQ